jgi:nicotinate phosphoribosyltransferase
MNGFGVGTGLGVSADAPALDAAYKLTAYAGKGRLKLSAGKTILPGRKQIFRIIEKATATHDVLARCSESLPGRPLLEKVMERGRRLPAGAVGLDAIRERAAGEISRLPARIRGLAPAADPYRVEISRQLAGYQEEVGERVAREARY